MKFNNGKSQRKQKTLETHEKKFLKVQHHEKHLTQTHKANNNMKPEP